METSTTSAVPALSIQKLASGPQVDYDRSMSESQITTRPTPESRIEPFDAASIKTFVPKEAFISRCGSRKKWKAEALCDVLNEICNTGVMYRACHAHGLSFPHFAKLRKEWQEIEDLVEMAHEFYRQKISHVIHDRAVDGWMEPVFFKGECVGHVQKFSDRLLELQAKRHCPEYRDKSQVDHNVTGGVLLIPAAPTTDVDAYKEGLKHRKQVTSSEHGTTS